MNKVFYALSKRAKAPSKAPSQRQLRVGEEVRHHLSTALLRGDVYVPELEGISADSLRGICEP